MLDPLLEEFSTIIVDEAHERDRFTEFLLIILRWVGSGSDGGLGLGGCLLFRFATDTVLCVCVCEYVYMYMLV